MSQGGIDTGRSLGPKNKGSMGQNEAGIPALTTQGTAHDLMVDDVDYHDEGDDHEASVGSSTHPLAHMSKAKSKGKGGERARVQPSINQGGYNPGLGLMLGRLAPAACS